MANCRRASCRAGATTGSPHSSGRGTSTGFSTEDTTVVRISGRPGVHYAGTISSQSDGRRDISGTLGDAPDEYPTRSSESGQVVTSVNKDPNDKGMLRVDLYVNGDVVDSVSDDSGVAPLTVYFAGGAH